MNAPHPLHLEIQKHRRHVYGLIRSSYREDGRVKHTTHGRLVGMSLEQLKLIQAAFRGEVIPKDSPDALRISGSKEYGASAAALALARELGLDRAIYSVSVHWNFMHAGRIMLRDDSAMNFSPETYDMFIRPYDAKLLRIFGGGAVHFCGRGDHYIASCCTMEGLHGINMTQPSYNNMETIFQHTVDKGIKLIDLAPDAALACGRDLHGCVQCR